MLEDWGYFRRVRLGNYLGLGAEVLYVNPARIFLCPAIPCLLNIERFAARRAQKN